MTTLTQPLNYFIKEQINLGNVDSILEAESLIIEEINENELERKLLISKNQIKNGEYMTFDDNFIDSFLKKVNKKYSKVK